MQTYEEQWKELLTKANELRAAARELGDDGLHELANAKMRELAALVDAHDARHPLRSRMFIVIEVRP